MIDWSVVPHSIWRNTFPRLVIVIISIKPDLLKELNTVRHDIPRCPSIYLEIFFKISVKFLGQSVSMSVNKKFRSPLMSPPE